MAFEDLPEEKKKPPLTAEDLIFDRNSGPEDEDDDEDAEDEDKEEEELIYDEKE